MLSESLNVGIRLGDMQYTLETEVFEELQDRKPIVIDPTLVRAAQLVDIHLLNEAKERGNDLKFLVQMCLGGRFQQTPSKPSPVGELYLELCRISPQLSQSTLNKIINPLY